MECVVGAILRLEGNEAGKLEWLNTIFAVVDEQYGCIHSFEDTIKMTAASMPEAFLSYFEGTEEQQQRRIHFIHYDDVTESPIANIDVNVLIEWCLTRNDINVWAPLAKGIRLWSVGMIWIRSQCRFQRFASLKQLLCQRPYWKNSLIA